MMPEPEITVVATIRTRDHANALETYARLAETVQSLVEARAAGDPPAALDFAVEMSTDLDPGNPGATYVGQLAAALADELRRRDQAAGVDGQLTQPPAGHTRVAELEADLEAATTATVVQVGRALRAELALRDLHEAATAVAGLYADDVELPASIAPAAAADVRRLREALATHAPPEAAQA